jgi:hypothetical protein
MRIINRVRIVNNSSNYNGCISMHSVPIIVIIIAIRQIEATVKWCITNVIARRSPPGIIIHYKSEDARNSNSQPTVVLSFWGFWLT